MASTPAQRPPHHRVRVRPGAVAGLSDEQLLREWRVSLAALQFDWTTTDIPAVVGFRHRCLDEFELRHPQAFRKWLLSGPRADGAPTPNP